MRDIRKLKPDTAEDLICLVTLTFVAIAAIVVGCYCHDLLLHLRVR